MEKIQTFRDLEVWKRSRKLVKAIYDITHQFPKEETFGLTAQLRRAIVSVPSNIAEGHSRSGTKDYIQFISIAIGSLAEVETQLYLSEDLGYVAAQQNELVLEEINQIQRMLHSLRTSLRAKLSTPVA